MAKSSITILPKWDFIITKTYGLQVCKKYLPEILTVKQIQKDRNN